MITSTALSIIIHNYLFYLSIKNNSLKITNFHSLSLSSSVS